MRIENVHRNQPWFQFRAQLFHDSVPQACFATFHCWAACGCIGPKGAFAGVRETGEIELPGSHAQHPINLTSAFRMAGGVC